MKQSFQDGVDAIYNKIASLGTTPGGKDLDSILAAIQKLYASGTWELKMNVRVNSDCGAGGRGGAWMNGYVIYRYKPSSKQVYIYNAGVYSTGDKGDGTTSNDGQGHCRKDDNSTFSAGASRNVAHTGHWGSFSGNVRVTIEYFKFI